MTIAPEAESLGSQWVADWAPLGRCAGSDPDALFVQGKAQRAAKVVCKGCPVVLLRATRAAESGLTGKQLAKAVKRARAA